MTRTKRYRFFCPRCRLLRRATTRDRALAQASRHVKSGCRWALVQTLYPTSDFGTEVWGPIEAPRLESEAEVYAAKLAMEGGKVSVLQLEAAGYDSNAAIDAVFGLASRYHLLAEDGRSFSELVYCDEVNIAFVPTGLLAVALVGTIKAERTARWSPLATR